MEHYNIVLTVYIPITILIHGTGNMSVGLHVQLHCFGTVNATISSPLRRLTSMHTKHMASQRVFWRINPPTYFTFTGMFVFPMFRVVFLCLERSMTLSAQKLRFGMWRYVLFESIQGLDHFRADPASEAFEGIRFLYVRFFIG